MKRCFPVLTIAGSDSGGGAGIEADIKTIAALGGYATAAITAITAQNTLGVTAIEAVSASMVAGQIEAVMTDIGPRAIKTGMLGSAANVEAVAHALAAWPTVPLVADPVLASTSGSALATAETLPLMKRLLVPLATLLTPNLPEAERLTGRPVDTPRGQAEAAHALLDMGCGAVLLKGGHAPQADTVADRLFWREPDGTISAHTFAHPFVATRNTHGTGCTLSAAIATHLAMGHDLHQAVAMGIDYLCQALDAARDMAIGHGYGPVNHGFAPRPMATETGTAPSGMAVPLEP